VSAGGEAAALLLDDALALKSGHDPVEVIALLHAEAFGDLGHGDAWVLANELERVLGSTARAAEPPFARSATVTVGRAPGACALLAPLEGRAGALEASVLVEQGPELVEPLLDFSPLRRGAL